MFGKLKEKLKSWTKNLAKEVEEQPKEQEREERLTKAEKQVKKEEKRAEKAAKKIEKEKTKELKLPEKFNPGTVKYEPDLSKAEELVEEIKKEQEVSAGEPTEETISEKKEKKGLFKHVGKVKISEKEFDIYDEELENLLLENNVAFDVAEKIIQELKEKIVGKELLKKEVEEEIKDTLKEIITNILVEPFDILKKIKEKKEKPYIILFCGINGSGKTTTIAKIAEWLKKNKVSCVLAAGDTFRAASIEQLQKHGERIGVKVISHDYGSDPASVGFDAIQNAKKNHVDCVLIDTAGRMHTEKNLLKEMEKIVRVCKPDLKIFVGESITGNDAVEQVKSFDWAIGIDGIVLTKSDIDEKGGTSLSVGFVTKKPILFLGTGQEYDEIEPFNKEKFVKRLGL